MKNLFIKLGLWEEKIEKFYGDLNNHILVDQGWAEIAMKHYCGVCERWFADVRGKINHNRYRHKE